MKAFKCDCCESFYKETDGYTYSLRKTPPVGAIHFDLSASDFCGECGAAIEKFVEMRKGMSATPRE